MLQHAAVIYVEMRKREEARGSMRGGCEVGKSYRTQEKLDQEEEVDMKKGC